MPAVDQVDDSLIGSVLADKYRVVREIGRGGMGLVYEAEHVALGKRVAVKVMLEKYAEDSEAIARFQREALAASRIGNPHIIDVKDIGTAPDGRCFVVMELLDGMPLSQLLQMTGPMSPVRAVQIIRQVLRAVGAAHDKGIIHRDLKPDNIFVVNGGDGARDFVKLLDFGISKMVDLDEQIALTKLTTTGVVMGTPLYMAPEQAMGTPIDRHADLYAIGVILYELLAGKPPFEGATYAVLVAKVLTAEPPMLSNVRPGLPRAIVQAVHRALEKDPVHRFQSAEQFAAALPQATPSQLELAATVGSDLRLRATGAPRRKRTWLAALAAFVVAAGATGVILMLQSGGEDNAPRPSAGAGPIAEPGSASPMPAPVPGPTGVLEVKSIPSGATVLIDNKPAGTTPIDVTLPAGRHRVRVELAEYVGFDMDQDIRANERTSVVMPLQKAAATKPSGRGRGKPDARGDAKTAQPVNPYTGPDKPPSDTKVKPPPPADDDDPKPPADEPKPRDKGRGGTGKPNPY